MTVTILALLFVAATVGLIWAATHFPKTLGTPPPDEDEDESRDRPDVPKTG